MARSRFSATEMTTSTSEILHASCVALNGQAVLLRGPAGAGKSALALELLALGCGLIADDRTIVTRQGDQLFATCPAAIKGMIEARGVGILAAETTPTAPVRLVVDLEQQETDRLPPFRQTSILGISVAVLHIPALSHFPAAILLYLKGGRIG